MTAVSNLPGNLLTIFVMDKVGRKPLLGTSSLKLCVCVCACLPAHALMCTCVCACVRVEDLSKFLEFKDV